MFFPFQFGPFLGSMLVFECNTSENRRFWVIVMASHQLHWENKFNVPPQRVMVLSAARIRGPPMQVLRGIASPISGRGFYLGPSVGGTLKTEHQPELWPSTNIPCSHDLLAAPLFFSNCFSHGHKSFQHIKLNAQKHTTCREDTCVPDSIWGKIKILKHSK